MGFIGTSLHLQNSSSSSSTVVTAVVVVVVVAVVIVIIIMIKYSNISSSTGFLQCPAYKVHADDKM
jgi:hypothetical protein